MNPEMDDPPRESSLPSGSAAVTQGGSSARENETVLGETNDRASEGAPENPHDRASEAVPGNAKAPAEETAPEDAKPRGIWNRAFFLLWQGQLVSALGDVVYGIALGFWILEKTGSTALMGSLMAVSALPRIVVAPFAGVIVDRSDRRSLLIFMDVLRGGAVLLVGLAALAGQLQVWMVFAAGILIGLGGAFFTPAVGSTTPDIVPRDRLVQANSAFAMIYTGSGIVGNSAGGFLYQLLGAPLMFLGNGISYLVSSFTILFIRIPKIVPRREQLRFFAELKEGLALVWRMRGLRVLFIVSALLNFFAMFGVTLVLPLFQRTESLGAGRYGIAMGGMTAGLFAGFLLGSIVKLPPARRFAIFMFCGFATTGCLAVFPLVRFFPAMVALLIISGIVNAILNSMIGATVQLTVPQDMRGKAFSLMGAISQGLTPISMALAGVLGEFFPLRAVIAAAFALAFVFFVPLFFSGAFRRFVNFDPDTESTEVLLG